MDSRAVIFSVLLLSCGDGGSPDAGADVPAFECSGVEPFLLGGDGHADPLGAGSGEARAGRLSADDLPSDPSRLLTWAAGDFVLANDRIAVVIEDVGASDGFDPWGGKPVGLARVEGGALVEPADFHEFIPAVGRFTFAATSVGVVSDGVDAVVRAVGELRPIPFLDNAAMSIVPGDFSDLSVAVDYRLAPGAEQVEVTYTVANPRTGAVRTQALHVAIQRERMRMFAPSIGFAPIEEMIPWVGFADEDATSYAVEFLPEPVAAPIVLSGAALFFGGRRAIAPCATTAFPYYRLHVGGPGMNGLSAALHRHEGVATRTISGVVTEADGAPAAAVRVHAEGAEGYLSRGLTDASGRYELEIPAGETPRLSAYRAGVGIVGPVDGPDLVMPATGRIVVSAVDGSGAPLPVRVQVRSVDPRSLAAPERFGEEEPPAGRSHLAFPADGRVELEVLPGDHQVIVSRGYEYTLFDTEVSVTAGERVPLDVMLDRVVDTAGAMSVDYHLHTNRSLDAPDGPALKVRSAAGEGLEIPCRSDHDWVTEWETIIERQGLSASLFGVTSLEVTTFTVGHFGVLPMRERAELPNRGALVWAGRSPTELFADVRGLDTDPLLIINHPRLGGIGYFDAAGYDAETGEATNADLWDEGFSIVEVFNNANFEQASREVADWFSFLNQGRRVFAVGSSDSHGVGARDMVVGYPRTYLRLGVDSPEALRAGGGEAAVRDATRAGSLTVNGGIYIDAFARGDVRPGAEVRGAMASESVRVVVQAPPWVDVDALEVWVDGVLAQTIPIAETLDVVRFDASVDVSGRWVVFHAKGDSTLDPVHRGRLPFGVTSPIFFVP